MALGAAVLLAMTQLAQAQLAVMKNGDLTVIDDEVKGFVLDSNHAWIAK